MSGLKSIEVKIDGAEDLALISAMDDSVWLVVPLRWWDLSTLIWWLFCPIDRKAKVKLNIMGGRVVSCNAVRVASRHVRVRGF
jgi:hypothetical protein